VQAPWQVASGRKGCIGWHHGRKGVRGGAVCGLMKLSDARLGNFPGLPFRVRARLMTDRLAHPFVAAGVERADPFLAQERPEPACDGAKRRQFYRTRDDTWEVRRRQERRKILEAIS